MFINVSKLKNSCCTRNHAPKICTQTSNIKIRLQKNNIKKGFPSSPINKSELRIDMQQPSADASCEHSRQRARKKPKSIYL